MKRKQNIIELAMRHYKFVLALIVILLGLGIYSLLVMPKQEFPDVTIRQGLVVGVYPGATTAQVEEQVTKPLERYLFTFKEVKRSQTFSKTRDGIVYVMVALENDVYNKDEVWSKIKHGVSQFKMQLPAGVLALAVNDDFGDTSALLLALESENKTYRELERYAESLETKLRRIESASNLRHYGFQKEQIGIYPDKEKLASYGLTHRMLTTVLFTQGFTTSGGSVEDERLELPIHVAPTYNAEYEIAEQIIYSDAQGNIIRLKDVAKVVREYDEPNDFVTHNGKKAIILSLEMREGYNIVDYGKEVNKILEQFREELPDDVGLERIVDQPELVDHSVRSFLRDLFISIIVVILVMMVLFPFRSAVTSAISIPVSIFISIAVMYLVGIPINTVTLAALIVVLGMLVDNSIIVVDAYLENLDNGKSRWHAAIASAKEYFGSIALATLCICTIFFPFLLTADGIVYDFILHFPFTFAITLVVSLAIAMLFIPYLEYVLIKKGLKTQATIKKREFSLLDFAKTNFTHVLDWAFRFPFTTIGVALASIGIAVWLFTHLSVRMLPIADRNQFAVEVYLPYGSSLEQTSEICDSLYTILIKDEQIKSVTSFVGNSSPRFQVTYTPNFPAKNYAQLIVNTISIESTEKLLDKYSEQYAHHFPGAYVRFRQLDYQLVNTPFEIRLIGEDKVALEQEGDKLKQALEKVEGLTWLHTSFENRQPGIQVKLNPVKASRLGVTRTMVTTDLAMHYAGIPVASLWEEDYALPIFLKSNDDLRSGDYDRVSDEYVSTLLPGVSVPLRQIASVTPEWTDGQIYRLCGERTLSVNAEMKRGYKIGELRKKVDQIVKTEILPELPADMKLEYGGAEEFDGEEIIPPIIKGVLIALAIVFVFLLINFKKVSLALTALLSITLCSLGVSTGLWFAGLDFGVTSVLGVISLMGIISRNAIIMLEHAENLRVNHGYTARDAAYDAGKRRMTPIFLTSATTAVGVIPMILSRSSLWEPMGVVICAGTIVSTVLIVTVLPVIYWKIYGNK